ncbi:hypothetical protein AQI88_06060 [Streptomyces cellostaticus]|uniref:Uncharacterized protein n=1 Tax=Streptomyces cellostaticus TaxID=67285 RepID=A0A101NRB3_9ACTN|nr:hypothetical protein [Streptomyces cellostaticus]KUM97786.1 hypothetical protein AQI88_06060 [Streptomyces cellostaticus]GHI08251.1 hypothetical protein Scel_65720 [Streptomyces cellostaticus]
MLQDVLDTADPAVWPALDESVRTEELSLPPYVVPAWEGADGGRSLTAVLCRWWPCGARTGRSRYASGAGKRLAEALDAETGARLAPLIRRLGDADELLLTRAGVTVRRVRSWGADAEVAELLAQARCRLG